MKKVLVPSKEDRTADVVVIGGGIVGVASAFRLSRAGLDVILVEKRDGLATLTSAASIESFRLQFVEAGMAELAMESIGMLENFQELVGLEELDLSIHHNGYLFVTDDPEMLPQLEWALSKYRKYGINDVELLSGNDLRARFPFLIPDVVGGTFRRQDGWLSFHEVVQAFVKAGRARHFLETRVLDIETDAKGVSAVVTDRGRIATRVVVNAAGPFAGRVGEMVGLDLPLEPVRRQKAFIATPMVPQDAPLVIDLVNNGYWRPEAGGALLGWVDPDEPAGEPLDNPLGDWDFAAVVMDKVMRLTPFWGDVVEGLKKKDVNISAGQYVYTPDGQPLIGPVEEVPGFYLNCGHWAGMMLSPGAGRWVSDLITGKMADRDNPLRHSRFKEGIADTAGAFLSGH